MSKLLAVVLSFVKVLLFGKDTTHLNGDVLFPGHMNFVNKGGEYFHGSKIKWFMTLRGLNEWCMPGQEGANALVAEVTPTVLGYTIIYNRKLSHKDEDTVDRFGREINAKIAEENRAQEEENRISREKAMAAEAEQKRLAEVGKKYEARTAKIKEMAPGIDRKRAEKELNSGVLKDE